MPITPVNATPAGLGITIQRASDAENGVDAAFAGGMSTADTLRQRVKIQPYLEDAAVAQAKDAEGAANSRITLRPAEENLRKAEIKAAQQDHDVNDLLVTEVRNLNLQNEKNLADVRRATHPQIRDRMITEAETGAIDAKTGLAVASARNRVADTIADTLIQDVQNQKGRVAAEGVQILKLAGDPWGLKQFYVKTLTETGHSGGRDLTKLPVDELQRSYEQARREEQAQFMRVAELNAKVAKIGDSSKVEETLRTELKKDPEYAKYQEAATMLDSIKTTTGENATPAQDVATVFMFMKMLDPGSTVREGEQKLARDAASLDQRIVNAWDRLKTGNNLNPQQRKDMLSASQELFNARQGRFSSTERWYTNLAVRGGADPRNVLQRLDAEDANNRALEVQEEAAAALGGMVPSLKTSSPAAGGKPATQTAPKGLRKLVTLDDGSRVYATEVVDPSTGVASYSYIPNAAVPTKPATPAPAAAPAPAPAPAPAAVEPAPTPAAPAGPVIRPAQPNSGSLFGGRNVPDASSPGGWKKVPWGTPTTPPPE